MAGKISSLKIIRATNKAHQASVIFFHGSGDTGSGIYDWVKFLIGDIAQPHIKFVFPTAPSRSYTPLNGEKSNVWFDRLDITPEVKEHQPTLESIGSEVRRLIDEEIKSGISLDKIVVGGFSMGGALALHTAYNWLPGVAGVFAMSSFLNDNSIVYESLKKNPSKVPLLMFHGDRDTLVPQAWGEKTFKTLQDLGVQGKFVPLSNTLHELKKKELQELMEWIKRLLPYEKAV